jgi:tryptophan synthase alpha chain
MEQYGLYMIFLVTPQTSEERIRQIDQASGGFIYLVSTASTTGAQTGFGGETEAYFQRIANMGLKHPRIVGFGISNHSTFTQATTFNQGAIIGSAFIKMLTTDGVNGIRPFIEGVRNG